MVKKDNNSRFAYDLNNFIEKGAALDKTHLSITTVKTVSSSSSKNNISNSNQKIKSSMAIA